MAWAGLNLETLGCREEQVRVWLDALDMVAGADDFEVVVQLEFLEPAADPAERGAGGDRTGDVLLRRRGEEFADAWQGR